MRPIVRFSLAAASVGALASCSQRQEQSQPSDLRTFDVQADQAPAAADDRMVREMVPSPPSSSAPGIGVTAAPGVAFDYRYAFRLPTPRIATVQETHAAMCEKLGLEKCRITGMRYQLRGEDSIAAMLALRLDPAIARDFGKQAAAVVDGADGMLVDLEIGGTDAGTRIDSATRSRARLEADIDRLEAELKALGVRDPRRGDLAARIEEMRREIRSLDSARETDREALAGTPMLFHYGSGKTIPGFDERSPLLDAVGQAGRNIEGIAAGLIVIVASALPILLIGLLLLWAWRRSRPFLPSWDRPDSTGPTPAA